MKIIAKLIAFFMTVYALLISGGTVVLAVFYKLLGYPMSGVFGDGVKVGTIALMLIIAMKYFKEKKAQASAA